LDKKDKALKTWQWEIVREVFYGDGWQEKQDTRLKPDESRLFIANDAPKGTQNVNFTITVIPDNFYKGVYRSLLSDDLQADAQILIKRALDEANANDYVLFSGVVSLR